MDHDTYRISQSLRAFTLIFVILIFSGVAANAEDAPDVVAHKFFQAVNSKDYGVAWKILTKKSQNSIVQAVASASKLKPAKVKVLFEKDEKTVQNGFWDSFRLSSKADQVAGATFKTASKDAKTARVTFSAKLPILMFNEGGWKFGLFESFLPQGYSPQ
jgi:hypothetical protein